MVSFNDPLKVTITALVCATVGALSGLLGSIIFKNFKIKTLAEINKEDSK